MNIVVIIPAYNEEKTIGEVVAKCKMQNAKCKIIVINDGSIDRTAEIARQAGAIVLSHPINRGLGAALSTGIEAALRILYNAPQPPLNLRGGVGGVIITLDADGQHNPADISRVIEPIVKGEADVVIGSRFCGRATTESGLATIPISRRVANWCGNFFTWLLFGLWVSDSQSGFRAFSAEAARRLRLRTSTMEVSSEIIREIARLNLKMAEVPITVRYTRYSLTKAQGQGFFRGLETLWKLIVLRFFR